MAKILGQYGLLAVWLGTSYGASLAFRRLFGTLRRNMGLRSSFSESETVCLLEDYF
jgi:hypothetical protein